MRTILLFLVLTSLTSSIWGCDVCGGGSSGAWNGWIPQFGKTQIQIRNEWRNNKGILLNKKITDQYFYQADLNFRYFHSSKWMLQMSMPMRQTSIQYQDSSWNWIGLGDLRWGINRVLLQTNSEHSWNAMILLGAQWQMPTGKYMRRDAAKMILPLYLQNGSGAHSVLMQYYALLSHKSIGFWSSGGVQSFAKNELHQQWGNKWQTQAGLFGHTAKFNFLKDVGQLWGMVSVQYEKNTALREFEIPIRNTAASAWSAQAQCDVYWKNGVLSFFGTKLLNVSDELAIPISGFRLGTALTIAF